MFDDLAKWDREALLYLNGLGSETYDGFWVTVTKFPPWTPLFALIVFLLFWKRPWKQAALALGIYIAMVLAVSTAIFKTKEWVGRLRPNNDPELDELIRLLRDPGDFSFFSGHAASSFSIALMAVLLLRKRYPWIVFILVWPLLFSYSRIYLGVHYPSDIIVGALVGSGFAYAFCRLYERLAKVP